MADDEEPEDGLRLNTLDRFRKQSPRLLLEEYSHCEVPAGCGGVVLRWVDPDAGVPAVLRVVVIGPGSAKAWIDGVELQTSRTVVAAGERVLAIELLGIEAPAILLVELQRDLGRESHGAARPVLTRTLGDRRWLASPDVHVPDDWTAPEFADERAWLPLAATDAVIEDNAKNSWRARSMRQAGTQALVLPDTVVHASLVRLRHRFFVEALPREEARG